MPIELTYTDELKKRVETDILETKHYSAMQYAKSGIFSFIKLPAVYIECLANLMSGSLYTRNWKKASSAWVIMNREKTDEEIFNFEMAAQIFYEECRKIGFSQGDEILEALKRGDVPLSAVEGAMQYDSTCLDVADYLAVKEGYKGKLSEESEKILGEKLKIIENIKINKANPGKFNIMINHPRDVEEIEIYTFGGD